MALAGATRRLTEEAPSSSHMARSERSPSLRNFTWGHFDFARAR